MTPGAANSDLIGFTSLQLSQLCASIVYAGIGMACSVWGSCGRWSGDLQYTAALWGTM